MVYLNVLEVSPTQINLAGEYNEQIICIERHQIEQLVSYVIKLN